MPLADPVARKAFQRAYYRRHREKFIAYGLARRKTHPECPKKHRQRLMKYRYALGQTTYEDMLRRQRGRCAMCKKKPKRGKHLDVDHNHENTAIRGLLCRNCNLLLGLVHDSPAVLERGAKYLRSFK